MSIGWEIEREGPLGMAVLFVDLVSSSEFASVLGLKEYADYVDSFVQLCREQCQYYFEVFLNGKYQIGLDYEFKTLGDELVVFMHTGRPHNDVYQLTCLAIALKCGWLASPLNVERMQSGVASAELAVGINYGTVWARRTTLGYDKCGFAINVGKRTEAASREGERFRIFLSDPAFKQINLRLRNLLFGPRRVLPMKGVVVPMGTHEVIESFVDPSHRLAPKYAKDFGEVARLALHANTFDLWIHSCLQTWEEHIEGLVSDERLHLCEHVLNIDPKNAVALYYAGQGQRERGDMETAGLYLNDLVRCWPHFADGWLELGRLLKSQGDVPKARECILQSRRYGVPHTEESLPGQTASRTEA